MLKRNKIPFNFHERIGRFEADFVVCNVIFEIDGKVHKQTNRRKDTFFASEGYTPIHVNSYFKDTPEFEKEILVLIANNHG